MVGFKTRLVRMESSAEGSQYGRIWRETSRSRVSEKKERLDESIILAKSRFKVRFL